MKTDLLNSLTESYDYGHEIATPELIDHILDDLNDINVLELISLLSLSHYHHDILLNTKFRNFQDVTTPSQSNSLHVKQSCITFLHSVLNRDTLDYSILLDDLSVIWSFLHYLSAYTSDIKANLSYEEVIRLNKLDESYSSDF